MPDLGPFIVAGVSLGAIYALGGMTIVMLFRSTGVLNLAHGGVGAVSALVAWDLSFERGQSILVALLVGIAVATAISVTFGVLIAPRLNSAPAAHRAAGTLGLALILFGAADWYWGDQPRSLRLPTDTWATEILGVRVTGTRLILVLLVVVIAIALELLLRHTRLGLQMRALADDRDHSALLGVRIARTDVAAWVIAGVLGGIAGIMLGNVSRLEAAPLTFLVIPAVAAAVGGRLSSLTLTLMAGIGMGVLETGLTPFGSVTQYRSVAPFAVAIVIVLVMSRMADTERIDA